MSTGGQLQTVSMKTMHARKDIKFLAEESLEALFTLMR